MAYAQPFICQVCGTAMEKFLCACARCGTPHHADCFRYNENCATFGCGEKTFHPFDNIQSYLAGRTPPHQNTPLSRETRSGSTPFSSEPPINITYTLSERIYYYARSTGRAVASGILTIALIGGAAVGPYLMANSVTKEILAWNAIKKSQAYTQIQSASNTKPPINDINRIPATAVEQRLEYILDHFIKTGHYESLGLREIIGRIELLNVETLRQGYTLDQVCKIITCQTEQYPNNPQQALASTRLYFVHLQEKGLSFEQGPCSNHRSQQQ